MMLDFSVPLDRLFELIPSGVRGTVIGEIVVDGVAHEPGGHRVWMATGGRAFTDGKIRAVVGGSGSTQELPRSSLAIDLSKPSRNDRSEPSRLDALEWAMETLARRLCVHGATWHECKLGIREVHCETIQVSGQAGTQAVFVSQEYADAAGHTAAYRLVVLHDVPEIFTGLDGDSATRLIVAAALRQGVGFA